MGKTRIEIRITKEDLGGLDIGQICKVDSRIAADMVSREHAEYVNEQDAERYAKLSAAVRPKGETPAPVEPVVEPKVETIPPVGNIETTPAPVEPVVKRGRKKVSKK